eukprot:6989150-Prymnesium_polylepis.1
MKGHKYSDPPIDMCSLSWNASVCVPGTVASHCMISSPSPPSSLGLQKSCAIGKKKVSSGDSSISAR